MARELTTESVPEARFSQKPGFHCPPLSGTDVRPVQAILMFEPHAGELLWMPQIQALSRLRPAAADDPGRSAAGKPHRLSSPAWSTRSPSSKPSRRCLYLQYENRTQEIHLYINCPGGSVSATLAIYDTMQFLECPIATYCMGLAASGAAIILAAGTKGKRYALPNSKVMIHQPWGQVGGQVSDIEIQANEILKDRASPQRDPGQAHRPTRRRDRRRNRPRPLLLRPGGQGVRPGGRGPDADPEPRRNKKGVRGQGPVVRGKIADV